ncbi:MAG TPA: hypothetical protein VGH07_07930 [Chthoniobacterales bacterium]|jgi:hypothetical protein
MNGRLLVYRAVYADGYPEYRFLPAEGLSAEDIKSFESELRKAASWFYPLGEIPCLVDENGGVRFEFKSIGELDAAERVAENHGAW